MRDRIDSVPRTKRTGGTNRRLLAAYRDGDRKAAERLVERTYEGVYAAACKLCGDPAEADDLTQETYRKAWQSLEGFEGRARISTWLYRITYTTFLNSRRGVGREAPLEEEASVIEDPKPTPEDRTVLAGSAEATRRAVLGLPEELRRVVAEHYWGDVPVSEIAEEIGITPVAVRKRLKKALALLASALEESH